MSSNSIGVWRSLVLATLVTQMVPQYVLACEVKVKHDDFKGHTVTYALGDPIGCGGNAFKLGLQRFQDKEGELSYQIFFFYHGENWRFIETGESLIVLADGTRLALTAAGTPTRNTGSGYVSENAMYEISLTVLRQLSTAMEVRLQLSCEKGGNMEGCFSEANKECLRTFLETYCASDKLPATPPSISGRPALNGDLHATTVAGKEVVLHANGTWEYSKPKAGQSVDSIGKKKGR